ncbi:MAG: hypothetical protein HY842_07215 [Bacteroidetes bacterium]|nr:hypothetical protein [Bacteroidota bacterium]
MSQIGLNSNIYKVSSKFLRKFNDYLVKLNQERDGSTPKQREELKQLVAQLMDNKSEDYQIQMVFMIIDEYLENREGDKSESVLKNLLLYLEGRDNSYKRASNSLRLITNALDQECDYAFSRIQKR